MFNFAPPTLSNGWEPPITKYMYKYQWRTRGENCGMCSAMDGRIYELDTFISASVYPGFHPNCDCYLSPVPIESITSDLDIFGSMLNLRNDSWIEFLFNNPYYVWWSLNVSLTRELVNVSQPGMTAWEAFQEWEEQKSLGMFREYESSFFGYGLQNEDLSWNVFRHTVDVFPTFGDILVDFYKSLKTFSEGTIYNDIFLKTLTGLAGVILGPNWIRPKSPSQTYHNPYYFLHSQSNLDQGINNLYFYA